MKATDGGTVSGMTEETRPDETPQTPPPAVEAVPDSTPDTEPIPQGEAPDSSDPEPDSTGSEDEPTGEGLTPAEKKLITNDPTENPYQGEEGPQDV